jgi:two-component system response regulator NreC
MSIRVLIADDHSMIRTGLRALLKSDPEVAVVGEAGDGRETIRCVEELAPDVVLLDIGMPGENGIEVARRLKGSFPQVRVLFLTMHEDPDLMREAIQAGAAGYVIKRAEDLEILNAIHAAYRGDLYVHPAMTRAFLEGGTGERKPSSPGGLPITRREVDILRLIARGNTNRQIAEALGLSIRTVESHRGNLMGKLGAKSRVELVAYAQEQGLL